jgi:hypothetical protein
VDQGKGKTALNDAPESSDRQRITAAESDIRVIRADAQTTANVLDGIAINQRETVNALNALKEGQYPPFEYVLKVFALGVALLGSVLAASFWLMDSRIREATRVLDYRVGRIEQSIVLTPTFVPAPATVPLQPQ